MSKPYGVLASAIVHQAVKDWQEGDDDMKAECERFFASDWYQVLRDLSPGVIPENMM
ncbi:MAG: hypothetical protein IJS84_08115 [Spirochaetales bacterium]|nr:hypothetical protein [Spirochaetales bacterium]